MTAWKIDDPIWMDQREREWKQIETILRYEVESKNELKQLRTYYLTGKLSKSTKVELFHQLWMHPDQNEDVWQSIIDNVEFEDIRRVLDRMTNESRTGYMNGIEGPIIKYLFGPDQEKGIIRFKDTSVNIGDKRFGPKTFFDHWRGRAIVWLRNPNDVDDCFCPYTIDFFFHLLPHVPEEYFSLVYYDPNEDQYDSTLLSLRAQISQTHSLFFLIAWFVEPRGLKGEDTNARRFAETMKREFDQRELPQHIKRLWEFIKNGEDLFLTLRDSKYSLYLWTYGPPVLHYQKPMKSPLALIKTVHQVYSELGFTESEFDPETIDTIELKDHLSEEFSDLLGFSKKESIPAYRYRLTTNTTYVNNTKDRIDIDIVVYTHHKDVVWTEKTPVAILLPRPADRYELSGNSKGYQNNIYGLNFRLARRTLAAKHGLEFRCYVNSDGDEREKLFFEPLVLDVPYIPFEEELQVMLNTPEDDFPILNDSPLPPLA